MSDGIERKLSGRCQCGEISYVVTGTPVAVGHCYCKNCQRLSGAGHSTAAMFPESSFAITGSPREYAFEPAPGVVDTRLFCPACGSQLFGKNSGAPGMLAVALGTLDDSNAILPGLSIYVAQKPNWDLVDEKLRVFEGTAKGQIDVTKQER
jgi:hypothetical protein